MMNLELIEYKKLNKKQKENYNFQKVSAIFADYGFVTIRLSDDWQGADFIASHINGELFLKIQLKGVLTVDVKYINKNIYICFRKNNTWYLYDHDEFLAWALKNTNISNTKGWVISDNGKIESGAYTWPRPNKNIMKWLENYEFNGANV